MSWINNYDEGNKFKNRKKASQLILWEICETLKIDFELMMSQKFVDKNSFFLKGKRKSLLYLKSPTFKNMF